MQKDDKEVRVAMNLQDPPYGCLTNGAHYPFTLKGKTWPTVDHYFHAQKFAGTPLEETIRRCKTAKQAGRAKGAPVRQDWDKIRHNVMYEGLMAKFKQHAGPRRVLRSTGTATIVGLMGKEDFWGAGKDGKGKNKWGELLMNVRLLLDGADDGEDEAEEEEEEKKAGGRGSGRPTKRQEREERGMMTKKKKRKRSQRKKGRKRKRRRKRGKRRRNRSTRKRRRKRRRS